VRRPARARAPPLARRLLHAPRRESRRTNLGRRARPHRQDCRRWHARSPPGSVEATGEARSRPTPRAKGSSVAGARFRATRSSSRRSSGRGSLRGRRNFERGRGLSARHHPRASRLPVGRRAGSDRAAGRAPRRSNSMLVVTACGASIGGDESASARAAPQLALGSASRSHATRREPRSCVRTFVGDTRRK